MDDTLFRVQKVTTERLKVSFDMATPEASFVDDLGADSLDVVDLVIGFEDELDITINDEEAEKLRTVADVVRFADNAPPRTAAGVTSDLMKTMACAGR